MDKAKEFQEWVLKYELSESTVKALQENGFDSTQSCELLNSAMIQKHFAKALTLRQTLLLQKAVDSLSTPPASVEYVPAASAKDSLTPQINTTTPPAADATSNASMPTLDAALQNQGLDATSLLSILSANQPSGQTTCHDNGKGLTFDPFDCTGTSASSKSYDIRDFITTMPTEGREGGSIKVGDVELNLVESKPKLDSVTPLQYMEASLRILREMALKDGANLPQVLQYVGYLVKIANMGQRFQWKSVIKYDAEYRKAQAEAGFPFGADSSFMMQLFLHDRPAADAKPSPQPNSSSRPQTLFDPRSGKPVCGRFNTPAGCKLPHCKFAHVCRACYGTHSINGHKDPAPSVANPSEPKKLPLEAPSPPSLPPLLQHLPAWEECLWNDPDREFIVNGIVHGFSLIDPQVSISDIAPAHVPNNKSTCSDEIKSCIDDAVSNELTSGGYIPCTEQPKIISALSAIPKPDGGVRLIHDLSRPADQSVNSYASKDYCKYESISDAIALIQPGWFMAVVDLKSAYRSVHIRPDEQCITGLQWQFSGQKQPLTMCDTRLPFGARKSPAIFNRITQAVARSLRQAGHHVVVYLHDFFVCGPHFVSCKATYDALILKLRNLGFQISWNKVVDPCQQLVFLGIQIDTMTGHLSLKPEKLS